MKKRKPAGKPAGFDMSKIVPLFEFAEMQSIS